MADVDENGIAIVVSCKNCKKKFGQSSILQHQKKCGVKRISWKWDNYA